MPRDAPSILSGEWINDHVSNVLDRIEGLIEHLVFEGLLSSGYAPMETPITRDVAKRLTPDQLQGVLELLPEEDKPEVMELVGEEARKQLDKSEEKG